MLKKSNLNNNNNEIQQIKATFLVLNREMINSGYQLSTLRKTCYEHNLLPRIPLFIILIIVIIAIFLYTDFSDLIIAQILGTRCILPNNYFIWEATRPISNCQFCLNVTRPIILPNLTRDEFGSYAYTSKPIIIKNAFQHWPAMKYFNYNFLKRLYETTDGSFDSVEEDCQFLHFHSDFTTLRDVFTMSEARAKHLPGEKAWYVGWCNNHPDLLKKMRRYYPVPHFLPIDSELSNREYIFMGYEEGANMHLDFISRLMWQAQLKGNKTWHLIPSPECEDVCQPLSFYVEPGDAMLLDTRVWYHGTTIAPGEFSLTIQSETCTGPILLLPLAVTSDSSASIGTKWWGLVWEKVKGHDILSSAFKNLPTLLKTYKKIK